MAVDTINNAPIVALKSEPKPRSLIQIAIRRYLRHRMAVFGTFLLLGVILFITLGSLFYRESEGNMTRLRGREAPPGTLITVDRRGDSGEMKTAILGTDISGRDVFIRLIYGGQISIAIGVTSVTIAVTLGTIIGLVAGYFGGWVDGILSRITEVFLAIPALILLLVLSAVFSKDTATVELFGRTLSRTVIYIVLLIGFTSWMPLSRIVRSQVLSIKEQEYILAARAIGVRNFAIIFRHLLPNVVAPIVVAATLGVGTAIITEAYLSFLGFGVQPPTATWGNIIDGARGHIDNRWWLWVFPGSMIVMTVLAINFIGDGLRDALDPRSIE
ncbi:MAG: ABC transporter permease [Anaerolineaceae bacterium]|nr:MAG: ABC transporter permease [Anaerolineaceae bacterium]